MHVEGEGGRRAALAQRLERDRVAEKADALTAIVARHSQREKALLPQPVVILGRVRGVAVVPSGAGREIGGEREAALPQFAVLVAEPKIHCALRHAGRLVAILRACSATATRRPCPDERASARSAGAGAGAGIAGGAAIPS